MIYLYRHQGILPHTDGPFYYPRAAILSLESTAIFYFLPRLDADKIGTESVSVQHHQEEEEDCCSKETNEWR